MALFIPKTLVVQIMFREFATLIPETVQTAQLKLLVRQFPARRKPLI